jgi:uncharacterized protein YegL
MAGEPIQAVKQSLLDVHAEIGSNPVVADKAWFSVIAFSTSAQVLLPLTDLSWLNSMPDLQAGGGTSYGAAFDLLYDTIQNDVAKLKADGNQVFRPAVFFLSDGQPTDKQWDVSYKRVIDPSWGSRPNILAFGFGTADAHTLQQVATVRAFLADGTMSAAHALNEFAQSLIKSIVYSTTSASPDGGLALTAPETVPGFITLPADRI